MIYGHRPLYPALGPCGRETCVRVPVFGAEGCGHRDAPDECFCQSVTIENPRCRGERAEVLLGVDACGNLSVCVRREGTCRPRRPCDRLPERFWPDEGRCPPLRGICR